MDYTESVMDKILEQIKSETEITKEEKMEYLNSIFGEDIKKLLKIDSSQKKRQKHILSL